MNRLILLMCVVLITLQSHSSGMYEEASKVGINNNCLSQLKMLTDVLQPIGVNLVSYKIEDPSKSPSYHFGQQKNKDGSTTFTVSLSPKEEVCSWSYTATTVFDDTSCSDVKKAYMNSFPNMQVLIEEQGFGVLKANSSLSVMTVERGDSACTVLKTESQFF